MSITSVRMCRQPAQVLALSFCLVMQIRRLLVVLQLLLLPLLLLLLLLKKLGNPNDELLSQDTCIVLVLTESY